MNYKSIFTPSLSPIKNAMKLFTVEKPVAIELSLQDLRKIRKQRKKQLDERYKCFSAFRSVKFP